MEVILPLKRRITCGEQGAISQKMTTIITTAVRTSYSTYFKVISERSHDRKISKKFLSNYPPE
jgi:hypothetical protein